MTKAQSANSEPMSKPAALYLAQVSPRAAETDYP